VNRNGTEYSCVHNAGIFDGPVDVASISAMESWGVNAVRIPLNEDCWLGINGAPAAYSGAAYQQAIKDYVGLLTSSGLHPILDLHWTAPGTALSTGARPMPDADHPPAFWSGRSRTTTPTTTPRRRHAGHGSAGVTAGRRAAMRR